MWAGERGEFKTPRTPRAPRKAESDQSAIPWRSWRFHSENVVSNSLGSVVTQCGGSSDEAMVVLFVRRGESRDVSRGIRLDGVLCRQPGRAENDRFAGGRFGW